MRFYSKYKFFSLLPTTLDTSMTTGPEIYSFYLQGQQLCEAMLCCPVPKHLRAAFVNQHVGS